MINRTDLISLVISSERIIDVLNLKYIELIDLFGLEFANMKDYEQNNPHHCYDLLRHCIETVLSINKTDISEIEFIELRIAALFHDIGKPVVAKEKGNKTVFYDHSIASKNICIDLFERIGLNREESDRILFYIAHHDDFISFKLDPEFETQYIKRINYENVREKIENNKKSMTENHERFIPEVNHYILLLKLCNADINSQSNEVIENGIVTDSKETKQLRLKHILQELREIQDE